MKILGFSQEEQSQVFTTLACILHLGNVGFKSPPQKDHCSEVSNPETLQLVASLLETSAQDLEQALISRNISTRNNRSRYSVPLNVEQATDSRDALAKALYASVFDWLIQRINDCLNGKADISRNRFIGLLDIFGFEVFQV